MAAETRMAFEETPEEAKARRRRFIYTVIIASIVVHLIFGIFAGFWIVARYFQKPKATFEVVKRITIDPEERKHRLETEQMESLRPKPVFNNRIASLRPTDLVLPDLPKLPVDQVVPLDTDALVNDQIDSLSASGSGQGSGSGGGFFGGSGKAGTGLLEGVFYDLKQTPNGEPTGFTPEQFGELIKDIARGWKISKLQSYFRAPANLYATRILMPNMEAAKAPEEFGVADKVQPSMWIVHYKGRVSAPETGSYRFVGIGDDLLLVRFNGRIVLDGSFYNARVEESRERRLYQSYQDPVLHEVYEAAGGHAVGKTFSVQKGKAYDIEILVGENPGGFFCALLQIEKLSEKYNKDERGNPIIPFFELTKTEIPHSGEQGIPLHAETKEPWTPKPEGPSFWDGGR